MNCIVARVSKVEDYGYNEKYPHLLEYIEDESDVFIVNEDNPEQFWPASEYFFMEVVKRFVTEEQEI